MTVASRAVMMAVMTEARTTDVEQEGHTSLTISTLVGQELVEGPIVSSPAIYRDCLVDLVAGEAYLTPFSLITLSVDVTYHMHAVCFDFCAIQKFLWLIVQIYTGCNFSCFFFGM